ncbi:MAG: sigma-70 family RNA polymerase sigma factor [Planctomycetes bacterium]|nr:sigma-70 family RNA polymerase sigma factor [Planctomycetota bacterium]
MTTVEQCSVDEIGECINRILEGEVDEFEIIVTQYERLIWHVVNGFLFNNDVAEDIVQQSFIQVFNNLNQYDNRYPFSSWVSGITRNQCLMYLRSQSIQLKHLSAYRELISDDYEKEEPDNIRMDALSSCQQNLQGESSSIIQLKYNEGLTFEEIANRIGRSVNATAQMASRIRIKLKQCVETKVRLL